MAQMKCVAICRAVTNNKRSGEWSETYYINASSIASAFNSLASLMDARMGCAATGISCYAFKITNLDSPGISQTFTLANPKNGALGSVDTPWQTLTMLGVTANGNKRVLKFPGVPDSQIVLGGYSPNQAMTLAVAILKIELVNKGWALYGEDLLNPRVDVLSVDGTGAYVFSGNTTGGDGDALKFYRTRFKDGTPVTGIWRINTAATPTTGTIRHWPAGAIIEKGKVFKYTRSLKLYSGLGDENISKRNLGRAFFQFVGRRTRTL